MTPSSIDFIKENLASRKADLLHTESMLLTHWKQFHDELSKRSTRWFEAGILSEALITVMPSPASARQFGKSLNSLRRSAGKRLQLGRAARQVKKEQLAFGKSTLQTRGRKGGLTASANRRTRQAIEEGGNLLQSKARSHIQSGSFLRHRQMSTPESISRIESHLPVTEGLKREYEMQIDRTVACIERVVNDPGFDSLLDALSLFFDTIDLRSWASKGVLRLVDAKQLEFDRIGESYAHAHAKSLNEVRRHIRDIDAALQEIDKIKRSSG